ncbi:MauE/DoxX family redox-associated membrane protein [Flavobacteriaceae bacterium M23B6Z8]
MKKLFIRAVAVFVGLVYLLSAVGKIISSDSMYLTLESLGLVSLKWGIPILITFELGLALFFIFLLRLKEVGMVSILFLLLATLINYGQYYFFGIEDCGCFGAFTFLNLSPNLVLARNALLIILSFLVFKHHEMSSSGSSFKSSFLLFAIAATLVYTSYTTFSYAPEALDLKGKELKNTALRSYINISKDSTYLLYLFKPDCSHCIDATPKIMGYDAKDGIQKVIGVTYENMDKELEVYNRTLNPVFPIVKIPKDSIRKLLRKLPTAFYIKEGRIHYIMEQNILSPEAFVKAIGK